MNNLYIRTVLFISIKSCVYSLLLLTTGWIFGRRIPDMMYAILFYCVYAILTFVFSEWIFEGVVRPIKLASVILIGYVIDMLVASSFFSWYFERNTFLDQPWSSYLLSFVVFAVMSIGAYVFKKRMLALRRVSEGLA